MSRPPISIVVPFLGDGDAARATIAAFGELSLEPGDELILADNTPDGVGADSGAWAQVIHAPEQRSSYHARNRGAAAASAEWLLFVDADCVAPPTLLDDFFASSPAHETGIVAGEVVGLPEQSGRLARWARSRRGLLASHHLQMGPLPAGITGNLLVRRATWEEVGGFDESVRSGADVEFCWRAQRQGWGFEYAPHARVLHRDPETIRGVLRQAFRYGTGRRWLRERYGREVPAPSALEPLGRALAGILVWTLTARIERALFKAIDGAVAVAARLGFAVGDNRTRPG